MLRPILVSNSRREGTASPNAHSTHTALETGCPQPAPAHRAVPAVGARRLQTHTQLTPPWRRAAPSPLSQRAIPAMRAWRLHAPPTVAAALYAASAPRVPRLAGTYGRPLQGARGIPGCQEISQTRQSHQRLLAPPLLGIVPSGCTEAPLSTEADCSMQKLRLKDLADTRDGHFLQDVIPCRPAPASGSGLVGLMSASEEPCRLGVGRTMFFGRIRGSPL